MKYLRGFLFILVFWYLAALAVNQPIIPYPHQVLFQHVEDLRSFRLYFHMLFSLYRILMGMTLAILCAVPTGMLAGRTKALDRLITPVLYLLYPLPKIAFLPVFMVLFGIGDLSKILLIATIIFFPAALTIRDGVREIPNEYLELARAYHLTGKEVTLQVVWPSILPRLFSSLRLTLGISLSVLFISENYAATYGLGYYIMNNWIMAQYIGMYAGIVLLSLLGLVLYIALDAFEAKVIPPESR